MAATRPCAPAPAMPWIRPIACCAPSATRSCGRPSPRLDEPYREVVALRFFAERSLAEIAVATDRPLGTVKTHLHRGLARLRRTLDETDR